MASAFTHAVAAAAIGSVVVPGHRWLITIGAACAVAPDVDVVGFRLGIRYEDLLGHRGLSHSIAFAAALAIVVAWLLERSGRVDVSVVRLAAFLFAATLSHGLLDALTNGGLGVAFFAPFSERRYFLPWRPIVVSPISLHRFFTGRGLAVIVSELLVVWLPASLVAAVGFVLRRRRASI